MLDKEMCLPLSRQGFDLATSLRPEIDLFAVIGELERARCRTSRDDKNMRAQGDTAQGDEKQNILTHHPIRVVVCNERKQMRVSTDASGRLHLADLSYQQITHLTHGDISHAITAGRFVFLGVGDNARYYGLGVDEADYSEQDEHCCFSPDSSWRGIRQCAHELSGVEAMCTSHAIALYTWHRHTRYCTRCGSKMKVQGAGWEQYCSVCDTVHYPRHDPAIIVGLCDENDRLLLARNARWASPRSVSVIAGFIEAGESAELAVVREVEEETGLQVQSMTYCASQCWPFDRSLMLGYLARVVSCDLSFDHNEIEWGRFYTRHEYRKAVSDGTIQAPPASTIASFLIQHWLDREQEVVGV